MLLNASTGTLAFGQSDESRQHDVHVWQQDNHHQATRQHDGHVWQQDNHHQASRQHDGHVWQQDNHHQASRQHDGHVWQQDNHHQASRQHDVHVWQQDNHHQASRQHDGHVWQQDNHHQASRQVGRSKGDKGSILETNDPRKIDQILIKKVPLEIMILPLHQDLSFSLMGQCYDAKTSLS